MGLKNVSDIETVHFHQNPAFAGAIKQVAGFEEITVNATTQAIDVSVYQTKATTAAAASVATLPAGTFPGQRKVITLAELGTGGDTLVVTPGAGVTWKVVAGTALTSLTFDAAGEYALIEWNGAAWKNVVTTATEA